MTWAMDIADMNSSPNARTASPASIWSLVTELLAWLAARGYADVQPVTLTEETLTFSLPHELRAARHPG